MKDYTIAVLGSHSALDVCRGAKDLGLKTLVICKKGREKTYQKYYATRNVSSSAGLGGSSIGCVDEVIVLDDFKEILSDKIQQELLKRNSIFVPNRSFEVYINDYDAIENKFKVPMFGNRKLLKIEERDQEFNQYSLLEKASIKFPRHFKKGENIDRLVIVKVPEKKRTFERGFFLASDQESFKKTSEKLIAEGKITQEALDKAVVEEFVLGAQVNFNFFYSPLDDRLEIIGTDTRRQTNLEGILRLTGDYQDELLRTSHVAPSYEEAGHIAVTVLESMLEDAFVLGEKFVKVCKEMDLPVIGPFALQTAIIPGPPKKEIIVFDISPRMPGSPGIFATPYSGYLYGENMSMGKRVAMEIKEAIEKGELDKILT